MHAPGRKAVGVLHADVEVGRVVQGNLVEHQAVGVVGDQKPGGEVDVVLWFGAAGHLPPAVALVLAVRAEQPGVAAAVDRALAHDRRVADIVRRDQGPATAAPKPRHLRHAGFLAELARAWDGRATLDGIAGFGVGELRLVDGRISRAEQGHGAIDQQSDAAPQFKRPGEKGISARLGCQLHGLAGFAAVERRLNSRGIELLFVGCGQLVSIRLRDDLKGRVQPHTRRRGYRLLDLPGILRTRNAHSDSQTQQQTCKFQAIPQEDGRTTLAQRARHMPAERRRGRPATGQPLQRKNSPNGGKAIRTFWRNSRRLENRCQGECSCQLTGT